MASLICLETRWTYPAPETCFLSDGLNAFSNLYKLQIMFKISKQSKIQEAAPFVVYSGQRDWKSAKAIAQSRYTKQKRYVDRTNIVWTFSWLGYTREEISENFFAFVERTEQVLSRRDASFAKRSDDKGKV